MPQPMKKHREALNQKHNQILCSIAGLRSTTSRDVLFRELDEMPLAFSWLLRAVTFWNNLAALPDNNLFKTVALDDCRNAKVQKVRKLVLGFAKTIASSRVFTYSGLHKFPAHRHAADLSIVD